MTATVILNVALTAITVVAFVWLYRVRQTHRAARDRRPRPVRSRRAG